MEGRHTILPSSISLIFRTLKVHLGRFLRRINCVHAPSMTSFLSSIMIVLLYKIITLRYNSFLLRSAHVGVNPESAVPVAE